MKIASIVGARPQFMKAAALSNELRKHFDEILIHTGQHYDWEMSGVFFSELNIPKPSYNLGIGSGTHAEQTGNMLIALEKVLAKERPDAVLVYGDTNSTIAGALAAAKLHIPVIHVEAGMRSFNKKMPEEINRIATDAIADLFLCSTKTAVENLRREGKTENVHLAGDVMIDALKKNKQIANAKSKILQQLKLKPKSYVLATVHRAENTDEKEKLSSIIDAMVLSRERIIFDLHPRTLNCLEKYGLLGKLKNSANITITKGLGPIDFLKLQMHAKKILTDSGGIQKEAYALGVPCITLRNETEWVESVNAKWNLLVGADKKKIISALRNFSPRTKRTNLYGSGNSANKICAIIAKWWKSHEK